MVMTILLPEVHLPLLHWHREWCAFGMLKQGCLIDIDDIDMMMIWCRWILKSAAEGVDVCTFLLNSLGFQLNGQWLTVPGQIQSGQANHRWQRLQHEGSISCCLVTAQTTIFGSGKWSPWQGEITLLYNTVVLCHCGLPCWSTGVKFVGVAGFQIYWPIKLV